MNYVLLAGKVKTIEEERFSLEMYDYKDMANPKIQFCKADKALLQDIKKDQNVVIEGKVVTSDKMPQLKIVKVDKIVQV